MLNLRIEIFSCFVMDECKLEDVLKVVLVIIDYVDLNRFWLVVGWLVVGWWLIDKWVIFEKDVG